VSDTAQYETNSEAVGGWLAHAMGDEIGDDQAF